MIEANFDVVGGAYVDALLVDTGDFGHTWPLLHVLEYIAFRKTKRTTHGTCCFTFLVNGL
jgi:hypothetical protein